MNVISFDEAVNSVRAGCVGVIPTDTLYGLVGLALSKNVVEKVYEVRKRNVDKPCIILLAHKEDLEIFEVNAPPFAKEVLERYWPGAVSIIFPCPHDRFAYLHRGTGTLAFRVPDQKHTELISFLEKTGPIIAPSANPQGNEPSMTIEQAYGYFSHNVDFFVDGGVCGGSPSTVISFEKDVCTVVRAGVVSIL